MGQYVIVATTLPASLVGCACVVALMACGLSVVGAGDNIAIDAAAPPIGGDAVSSPTMDGSDSSTIDGNGGVIPPPPPCLNDACAALQVSASFVRALFGDRATGCPSSFTNADVVKSPSPKTGACSCGACAPSATCTTGTIGTRVSTSDTLCGTPAGNLSANNGDCFSYNGSFVTTYCAINPPPAVLGSCSAPGVGVPSNVDVDSTMHLCHPATDSCAATFCAPPGSLKTCLVATGDVACPASASVKTLVGSEPDVTCAACACTTSSATCEGSVTFYGGASCTGATRVLSAGVCTQVNQASIKSTKWAGTAASLQCANVTPGAPTVSLKNARTVCCPP